jgi:hypothetical protein
MKLHNKMDQEWKGRKEGRSGKLERRMWVER